MKPACGPRSICSPPARAPPACSRSVRTRRRRISLRMAARCSVDEQQHERERHHEQRDQDARDGSPGRRGAAPRPAGAACCHQSTENLMIGRLIAPTSVRIAAARAARDGSSTVAPQRDHAEIHQEQHEHRGEPPVPHPVSAPHIGRPHSEPVTRQSNVNAAPIGAAALQRRRRADGATPACRAPRPSSRPAEHGEPGGRARG